MAQEANGKSPNMFQQQAQQYPATTGTPVSGAQGQWTTGLCGCFEDCSNCKSWNLLKVFLFLYIVSIFLNFLSFFFLQVVSVFAAPASLLARMLKSLTEEPHVNCKRKKNKTWTIHSVFHQLIFLLAKFLHILIYNLAVCSLCSCWIHILLSCSCWLCELLFVHLSYKTTSFL